MGERGGGVEVGSGGLRGEGRGLEGLAGERVDEGNPRSVGWRGGELLKEGGERLGHAAWIFDLEAWHVQAQGGEAEGHAVVLVCFDFGGVEGGGVDDEGVVGLLDGGAAACEFGAESVDAFALLEAESAEV
jgi:hypothetical protein